MTDDELKKLRFRELGVRIKGTWLEECVLALYRELEDKNLVFRPQCYLADEWLTPDNEPVVGIPFYLAHSRLTELERRLMHEVEGGDPPSCMRLLRHETGHAINYAYRLHTRKRWQQLFGHFSEEYPDRYKYRPYSRSFVIHLDDWYAQYHPDEDFAETFAVWLAPGPDWRERYRGWKALEKLEYVDTLMRETGALPPKKPAGAKHWSISSLKTTLGTHYRRKTEFYAEYSPDFHDTHLCRIFPVGLPGPGAAAHRVLARHRKDIVEHVAFWTGERKYIINRLLKNLIKRCRELGLTAQGGETSPMMKLTAYLTTLIMNYVLTGRFKR
ncbi:MAG: putative zinc-binding metallopeptidase [Endomicrobiales bacterium]